MKSLIILILSLAAYGQMTKDIVAAGVSQTGTLTFQPASTAYLTIDDTAKSRHTSMIVRNPQGEPIAFCNIPKGKCWSFPREMPETLVVREVARQDGPHPTSTLEWAEDSRLGFGSPHPAKQLHISKGSK